MRKNVFLLLGVLFLWVLQVNAQWSITDTQTQFTIDFENTVDGVNSGTFQGLGFTENPDPGELDANGWAVELSTSSTKDFGEEETTTIFAQGTHGGGTSAGGIYAFEVEPGNYALGIQPSGTLLTPGWIAMEIQNNTGETVESVEFSYDVWLYNDQDRSQLFNGEFSLDGETWTSVPELEFETPIVSSPDPQWEVTTLSFEGELGVDIEPGESLFFRWYTDDNGGTHARDEIAVDNINIIVHPAGGCEITEYPFLENFDGVFPPECWENSLWEQSTYGSAYSGSEWAYSNTAGSELTTPEFVVPSEGSYLFSFWYRAESANNPQDMDIEMSTDGEIFVIIESFEGVTSTTYQQYEYDLSAYSGQSVWFRFVGLSGTGGWSYGVLVDHVEVRQLSDENDILDFTLAEQYEPADIDPAAHTVEIIVQMGTDLSELTPTIAISEHATIEPESGATLDFTSPVTYTVTSESQLEQDWVVTVIESTEQSDANDIVSFSFPEETGPAVIDTEEKTVEIEVEWTADLTDLTPTIDVSPLATIDPESGLAQDFSSPFEYTVTAENEDEAIWTVNVSLGDTPLGANCSNPIIVNLPTESPYEEIAQTNCGLENIYNETCLGNYDTGEDIIYQLEVTESSLITIDFTPDVNYTGLAIMDACPDVGECIDYFTYGFGTSGETHTMEAVLSSGTYYVIISTWTAPVCITSFDLTITADPNACLAPTNLSVLEVWQEEATVTWSPGLNETEWNLIYGETGFDIASEGTLIENIILTEHTITNLTEFTDYDFYVRAVCGGEESEWSDVYTFTTLAACPAPTDVTASEITDTSADIAWFAAGGTETWNIKVSDESIDPESEIGNIVDETTTENPYFLDGLTDNTTYYVYVQADCSGEESLWTDEYTFTTQCGVFESFPFTKGFDTEWEGSPAAPVCWTVVNGISGSYWERSSASSNSGSHSARSYQGSASSNLADEWLILPAMDFDALENAVELTFYGYSSEAPDGVRENMRIMLLDNLYDNVTDLHENATEIDIVPFTQNWDEYSVIIGDLTDVHYIAFNYYITEEMSATFNWIYIDDIHVDQVPDCPSPTQLHAENITQTTADLYWTEVGPATEWNIKVSDVEIDPESESGNILEDLATEIPFEISDLDPNTDYWFYVQAECGEEQSTWNSASFTTECDIFPLPFSENFDGIAVGELPNCWTKTHDNWGVTNTSNAGGEAPELRFNFSPSSTDVFKAISPEFDGTESANLILEFLHNVNHYSNSYDLKVQVSIDGGTSWTDVWSETVSAAIAAEEMTIDISQEVDGETFHIAWVFDGNSFNINQWYIDNIVVREMSEENDIIDFTLPEQVSAAVIDNNAHTVDIEVTMGTDLSALTPTITVSPHAEITPESGETQDFTGPFTYTVISESQEEQDWVVTVHEATELSAENDIVYFSFVEETGPAVIDAAAQTVDIEIVWTADLANLVPTIEVSFQATIDPESGTAQDFSLPFDYTVTAENNDEAIWTVNVSQEDIPEGGTCANPIVVNLPAQSPYEDLGQTTCNLDNVYSGIACGGAYFNGNDIIYELNVTEASLVNIDMTTTDTYTGIAILDACPDVGNCLDFSTAWNTDPHELEVVLEPGNYFVIISTNPNVTECIDAFDLIINADPNACLAPTNLATVEIWQEEATVSWSPGLNETEWDLIYGDAGFDIDTEGTIVENILTNEYTITDLSEFTDYDFYVRAVCGGEESEWSDVYTFTTLAACPAPIELAAENITPNSAHLTWTQPGTVTEWNIKVSDVEIDPESEPGNIAEELISTIPFEVTDLDPNTQYWFYVQGECGSEQSFWVAGSFTTPCEAITEFPFYEDFNGDWDTWCWTVINNDGDSYTWSQGNQWITPTVSEPYAAHGMGNQDDYLITPALQLDGDFIITWWDKVESVNYPNNYYVKISTTGISPEDFTEELEFYEVTNTAWVEHTLDLSAYNGQTIYIAFHQTFSSATNWGFGIDDVTVMEVFADPEIADIDVNEEVQEEIEVCLETDLAEVLAQLPTEITVTDSEETEYVVSLDWTVDGFDPVVADTYLAVGTFELPEGVVQTEPETTLEVYTDVIVLELPEVICPDDMLITTTDPVELMGGLPEGGVYSGTNVEEGFFNPEGLEDGDYTITYTYLDENTGCENHCEFIITIDLGVSITDGTDSKLSIYPNPNEGQFIMKMSNLEGKVSYQIYDTKGAIIKSDEFFNQETNDKEFNLDIAPGIYYIQIVNNDNIIIERIVIQ